MLLSKCGSPHLRTRLRLMHRRKLNLERSPSIEEKAFINQGTFAFVIACLRLLSCFGTAASDSREQRIEMVAFSKTSIIKPKICNVIISRLIHRAGPLVVCFCLLINAASAQNNNDPGNSNTKAARKLGIEMLREIKSILSKDYYDPNF